MRKALSLLLVIFGLVLTGCGVGSAPIIITATPAPVTPEPTSDPTPTPETVDICDLLPGQHVCTIDDSGIGWPINPVWDIDQIVRPRQQVQWAFPGDPEPTFTFVDTWFEHVEIDYGSWFGWNRNVNSWSNNFVPQVTVDVSNGLAEFNVTSGKGRLGWSYATTYNPLQAGTGYLIKMSYIFEADCGIGAERCPFAEGAQAVSEYCTFYGDDGNTYRFVPQPADQVQQSGNYEEAAWFLYTNRTIGGEFHCGWQIAQGILDGPLKLDEFSIRPVAWDPDDAQVTIGGVTQAVPADAQIVIE